MKRIVTHSGAFHADEAMAIAILSFIPMWKSVEVVRSRVPEVWKTADILIDVGGEYNHSKLMYDHHQRAFNQTFSSNYDIKLSSAGLIYKHYGIEALRNLLDSKGLITPEIPDINDLLQFVHERVYQYLILECDCVDNGYQIAESESPIKWNYKSFTSLSSRIARLNPLEKLEDDEVLKIFLKAVEICKEDFVSIVLRVAKTDYKSVRIAREMIKDAANVHPSGKIVYMTEYNANISNEVVNCSTDAIEPLYIIYKSVSSVETSYRIRAVPIEPHSFILKKPFPKPWRGLRDNELAKITGVKGASFCHHNGFLMGADSYSSALSLAEISISDGTAD